MLRKDAFVMRNASSFYRIRFKTLKNNVHHTQYIYFEGSRYFIHCTRDTWFYDNSEYCKLRDRNAMGIFIYSFSLFLCFVWLLRLWFLYVSTRPIQTICLWYNSSRFSFCFRIVNIVINNYAARATTWYADHPSQCTLFWSDASTTT